VGRTVGESGDVVDVVLVGLSAPTGVDGGAKEPSSVNLFAISSFSLVSAFLLASETTVGASPFSVVIINDYCASV
jgi:hypothetical protein